MKLILRYFFISLCFVYANEQAFYLKYEKIQNYIYKDQIFRVDLSLLAFDDNIIHIESNISNYYGIKVFDNSMQWIYKGDDKDKFQAFLHLKVLSTNIKLPDINLTLIGYNNKYYKSIKGELVSSKILNWLDGSSHIISPALKVVSYQSNVYDKKHNIVTLQLKAKNTNLEDLHIKNNEIIEQNITKISYEYPYTTVEYYAIIPSYIKTFKLNYLNTNKNKFDSISLKIIPDNKSNFLVQDISPDIKTYDKYKLIFLMVLIALSLFMAYYRKKVSYLIITLLLILALFKSFLIQNKATIKEGSRLRVLPLETSTIFYINKIDREVIVLNRVGSYMKIQFQDKVGWINEKYIIND